MAEVVKLPSIKGDMKKLARQGNVAAVAEIGSRALDETNDAADIRRLADKLNSMKKIVGETTGKRVDINAIAKVWLKACRKGGKLLAEMQEAGERAGQGGDRKSKSHDGILKLKDLGFTSNRASRWQLLSKLPQERWNELEEKIEARDDGILTFAEFLKAAEDEERQNKRKARRGVALVDGMEFRLGDCREVLADVPDNSVPLILTDPPYPAEAEPLYCWLAEFAARVLIPGGSLICYTGHWSVPRDCAIFGQHLRFWWHLVMMHDASKRLPGKFVICEHKPVLWYVKEFRRGRSLVPDVLRSPARDKEDHDWGQGEGGVTHLIEHLTEGGERIIDPFAGTCLWGRIAASLGRRWLGSDIVEGGDARVFAEAANDP